MKKITNTSYYLKIFFFIIHFYFIFMMLHNILDVKIYGLIFLIFYIIYVLKFIIELLSKKRRFKEDFIYNLMQIGLMTYLIIISIRTVNGNIYVTKNTLHYFQVNYCILSALILFIILYSILVFNSKSLKK